VFFIFFCYHFSANFACFLLRVALSFSLENEANEIETNGNGKSQKKLEKILIKKIPENLPSSSAKKVRLIFTCNRFLSQAELRIKEA
jgi:hypothetical protein